MSAEHDRAGVAAESPEATQTAEVGTEVEAADDQPTATFLVIEHEDLCPPSWLGDWWEERGVALRRVRGDLGEPIPDDAGDADALIVLGGHAGANDDAEFPWLPATRALIAQSVDAGVPFLGVCLGHQLGTVALGGEVRPNPAGRAKGLTPIDLTDAGRVDPLLCGFDGAPAVQWNRDIAVALPARASVLATSPDGTPQAVRFAPWAYGVQFHPECSPDQFDTWTVLKPDAVLDGEDGALLRSRAEAVRAAGADLERAWRPLAARFLDLVADFRR